MERMKEFIMERWMNEWRNTFTGRTKVLNEWMDEGRNERKDDWANDKWQNKRMDNVRQDEWENELIYLHVEREELKN